MVRNWRRTVLGLGAVLLTVGALVSCGTEDDHSPTQLDAVEFTAPTPPPQNAPPDPTDFSVEMQFSNAKPVSPTSYSYSRCPFPDGDRCLGADAAWQSQDGSKFEWIQTALFGITPGAAPISITMKDNKNSPCVRVLQQDQWRDLTADNGVFTYPVGYPDSPIHLSVIPSDCKGKFDAARALAVWVSPRAWSAPPADAIVCDLKDGPAYQDQDWTQGDCTINKPKWRFSKDGKSILFSGTLWDMLDKPQKTIFVNVDEKLSLYTPLTNEYVQYKIHDVATVCVGRLLAAHGGLAMGEGGNGGRGGSGDLIDSFASARHGGIEPMMSRDIYLSVHPVGG